MIWFGVTTLLRGGFPHSSAPCKYVGPVLLSGTLTHLPPDRIEAAGPPERRQRRAQPARCDGLSRHTHNVCLSLVIVKTPRYANAPTVGGQMDSGSSSSIQYTHVCRIWCRHLPRQ